MKRIKIAFLIVAVVAATSSAFTTKQDSSTFALAYFEFTGANPLAPADYTKISAALGCDSDETLCYIRAEENTSTNKPTQASLDDLAQPSKSANFTKKYTGTEGIVRLED